MDVQSIIWSTFVSDSFSLATQWEYDQEKIANEIGVIDTLAPPPKNGFHASQSAGAFCNYGDHIFNLLQFIDTYRSFNRKQYEEHWKAYFSNYTGYADQASKHFATGKGGQNSHTPMADFVAVVRFTPLLLLSRELEQLLQLAWEECSMMYDNQLVHATLRCMVKTLFFVAEGISPIDALLRATKSNSTLYSMVQTGVHSAGLDPNVVIEKIGASCGIHSCLPSMAFLLASYTNLKELLMVNNMAGGEVAARAIGAAMLMTANKGMLDLPEEWVTGLQRYHEIDRILSSFTT